VNRQSLIGAGGFFGDSDNHLINDAAARLAVTVKEQRQYILPACAKGFGEQVLLVSQFSRFFLDGANLSDIGAAGPESATKHLADQ
jgi:hypothetical protein